MEGATDPKERPLCPNPSQTAQGFPSDLLGLEARVCKSPLNLNSLKCTYLRIIRIKLQLNDVDIFYWSTHDHLDPSLLWDLGCVTMTKITHQSLPKPIVLC